MGSAVTYSNEAKAQSLGVDPALIEEHGAVSAQVASEMAIGAVKAANVDAAVAVTGIAGPGGGRREQGGQSESDDGTSRSHG